MPGSGKPIGGELTEQQLRFCDEYMLDGCHEDAKKRAGYNTNKSMWAIPAVKAEIMRRFKVVQAKMEVSADDIRDGLAAIAFDPRGVDDGGPTHGERRAAFMDMAKLLGFLTDRVQVSVSLEDLILSAYGKTRGPV